MNWGPIQATTSEPHSCAACFHQLSLKGEGGGECLSYAKQLSTMEKTGDKDKNGPLLADWECPHILALPRAVLL